jgi:hypothetical protein
MSLLTTEFFLNMTPCRLAVRCRRFVTACINLIVPTSILLVAFNPSYAELNPICHLLVLLGDLTFMGPCIVNIFQYMSNKMQHYAIYLYLETTLHVSGGTSTHHQELIQLYLQHLVFVTPLLLSAAIVEELERAWVCCGWRTSPTAHWSPVEIRKLLIFLRPPEWVLSVLAEFSSECDESKISISIQ